MDNDELFASDGDDDSLIEEDNFVDDGADSVGSESSDSFDDEEIYQQHREQELRDNLQRVKANDPNKTTLYIFETATVEYVQNMTEDDWEEIGLDINNNTHLRELSFSATLNNQKMIALFRLLTRSNSIESIRLRGNGFNLEGLRGMLPFLQNASNLKELDVSNNNIGSEGFNMLFRALQDSPIKEMDCMNCGIKSIDIDKEQIPKCLTQVALTDNEIYADGCRELAKLLQMRDSTLKELYLADCKIDNESVVILVNALQSNTSLRLLQLNNNRSISHEGLVSLLKLVSDVSSIKATLQSNHTLQEIGDPCWGDEDTEEIQQEINEATLINEETFGNPEDAGRTKVIRMHLHSVRRAELAALQGVDRSLYSEINPLHLPEVLSLVGQNHGQEELFVALKSSVAGLISTVNREQCIQEEKECIRQKMAQLHARLHELDAELAAIEAVERNVVDNGRESGSNKRRRVFDENLE